jgi:hypothetical protein
MLNAGIHRAGLAGTAQRATLARAHVVAQGKQGEGDGCFAQAVVAPDGGQAVAGDSKSERRKFRTELP